MSMTCAELLASDIERALKEYLGTDSFPSDQWPAVARSFADLIQATGEIGLAATDTDRDLAVERVQAFLRAQAGFHTAVVAIVE